MVNLQTRDDDDVYCNYWSCYSYTSLIIKWVFVGAIIGGFILFLIIGYFHARRRMKKGLAPLPYHRVRLSSPLLLRPCRNANEFSQWLVPRSQRLAFHAAHPELYNPFAAQRQWYTPGYGQHGVPMQPYGQGPPPPQYGTPEYLPAYAPPAGAPPPGGNKTNPDQNYASPPMEGGSRA
jgi:hypothetical protein